MIVQRFAVNAIDRQFPKNSELNLRYTKQLSPLNVLKLRMIYHTFAVFSALPGFCGFVFVCSAFCFLFVT